MPDPCPVLVVDDHPLLRAGVAMTLGTAPDEFVCCGEAVTAAEACERVERLRPRAVILDLNLGGRDGPDLIEDLVVIDPEVRILVYTGVAEAHFARRALRAGARGYLAKQTPPGRLLEALRAMMRGELAVSAEVRQEMLSPEPRSVREDAFAQLSARELQILRRMGEGQSWAAIAAGLGLSEKTIGTYRERIKGKLRLRDAAELKEAALALVRERLTFLPPPEG